MMEKNMFADVLSKELKKTQGPSSQEALRILQDFCEGVESSTDRKVLCRLERGYLVNDGQEWRPMIQASGCNERSDEPSYVLLRAYVPADGWPVKLSTYDAPMEPCENAEKLRDALQEFLKGPSVVEQIRYLMTGP